MATTGKVDKAIRWLVAKAKQGDRVFIYFSGHGEVENVTSSKNGYLICYNTPSVAFIHMGLSIDYLNDVVNTMSVDSKAKVIVITDACHSGTMAGNKFKGNLFAGEQLMLKRENEIRMASSKPNQLSNEKADWGGGRGVFSYHLVNGLQGGLADTDHDKVVSVGELKNYLEHKMANDPVLKNEGDVQTPVITGDTVFKLATVVESEAIKVKEQVTTDSVIIMQAMSSMVTENEDENASPDTYFFNLLKKQNLEGLTDSLTLNNLAADDMAFAIITALKKNGLNEIGQRKFVELKTILENDKEAFNRFNLDLAAAFLEIGQNIIAAYIRGDEAELERRRYYNSGNNSYDIYPVMFEVAAKLSQSDKYYQTKATVLLHYFTGLVIRLKIPLTENKVPLIEQALAQQKSALALEEFSPYIYNELGVLYHYKKDYKKAEKYYTKATELSPGWAIPQSNLSSLFIIKKEYQKALQYVDKADSLQNNLQSTSVHRGFIHEMKSNLLLAEEEYRNAIEINSRHFAPFERLGYLYMSTTNYALADSFFYEAELRKKGYHFIDADGVIDQLDKEPNTPSSPGGCTFSDTLKFMPGDMLAWFAWGLAQYYALRTGPIDENGVAPHVNKNNAGAIRNFKKVITLNKQNPLVYHYLGMVYYEQHQWEEAELMFRYAMENYMNREAFEKYLDSVKKRAMYPYEHSCYEELFKAYYYQQKEDLYFLASLYEKWQQPVEAEKYYKRIIENDSLNLGVYLKLSQLLEKQNLYLQAENVLKQVEKYHPDTIYRQLNAFYRRVINKEPDKGEWSYKLGLMLYDHARDHYNYNDTIWFDEVNKEEVFADRYYEMADSNNLLVIPGTGEKLLIDADVLYPRQDGIRFLEKAAELISERETLASINYKIGEIYVWAGSKKMATPYFEKSLQFIAGNVNTRLKLVDVYTAIFKNSKALAQLNYLYNNGQIDFNMRLLLAKFDIYAGNYSKAKKNLIESDSIQPYPLPELFNLNGLLNMLANKPQDAIKFYTLYVKTDTADTDSLFTIVKFRIGNLMRFKKVKIDSKRMQAYTIARLYAKTGKSAEAFKWLETAINYGFNYSYVLQNDSYMESLRKTPKWKTMVGSIAKKEYSKSINYY